MKRPHHMRPGNRYARGTGVFGSLAAILPGHMAQVVTPASPNVVRIARQNFQALDVVDPSQASTSAALGLEHGDEFRLGDFGRIRTIAASISALLRPYRPLKRRPAASAHASRPLCAHGRSYLAGQLPVRRHRPRDELSRSDWTSLVAGGHP